MIYMPLCFCTVPALLDYIVLWFLECWPVDDRTWYLLLFLFPLVRCDARLNAQLIIAERNTGWPKELDAANRNEKIRPWWVLGLWSCVLIVSLLSLCLMLTLTLKIRLCRNRNVCKWGMFFSHWQSTWLDSEDTLLHHADRIQVDVKSSDQTPPLFTDRRHGNSSVHTFTWFEADDGGMTCLDVEWVECVWQRIKPDVVGSKCSVSESPSVTVLSSCHGVKGL